MEKSCEDIQILFKGYLFHTLTKEQENDVEIHLSHCADCRISLHDMMLQKEDGQLFPDAVSLGSSSSSQSVYSVDAAQEDDQPVVLHIGDDQPVLPVVPETSMEESAEPVAENAEAEESLSVFEQFMKRRKAQMEEQGNVVETQERPVLKPISDEPVAPVTEEKDTPLPPENGLVAKPAFMQDETPSGGEVQMRAAPKFTPSDLSHVKIESFSSIALSSKEDVVAPQPAVIDEVPVASDKILPAVNEAPSTQIELEQEPVISIVQPVVEPIKEVKVESNPVVAPEKPVAAVPVTPSVQSVSAAELKASIQAVAEKVAAVSASVSAPSEQMVAAEKSSAASEQETIIIRPQMNKKLLVGVVLLCVGGIGAAVLLSNGGGGSAGSLDAAAPVQSVAKVSRDDLDDAVTEESPAARYVRPALPPVRRVEPLDIPRVKLLAGTVKIPKVSDEINAIAARRKAAAAQALNVRSTDDDLQLIKRKEVAESSEQVSRGREQPIMQDVLENAQKAVDDVTVDEIAEYANKTITLAGKEGSTSFLSTVKEVFAEMEDVSLTVDDSQQPYVISAYMTNRQAVALLEKLTYLGATKIETKFRTKEDELDKRSMFYLRIE
jgi:hypothetical protein